MLAASGVACITEEWTNLVILGKTMVSSENAVVQCV